MGNYYKGKKISFRCIKNQDNEFSELKTLSRLRSDTILLNEDSRV